MTILTHTVKFNGLVTYVGAFPLPAGGQVEGVKFVNTTSGETASLVTHSTDMTTANDIIAYNVTWGVDPIVGDVVEFQYLEATGKYVDMSSIPYQTVIEDTFGDVADVALQGRTPVPIDNGNTWVLSNDITTDGTGSIRKTSSANNQLGRIDTGVADTTRVTCVIRHDAGVANNNETGIVIRGDLATTNVHAIIKILNTPVFVLENRSSGTDEDNYSADLISDPKTTPLTIEVVDDGINITARILEDDITLVMPNSEAVLPIDTVKLIYGKSSTTANVVFWDSFKVETADFPPLTDQTLTLINCEDAMLFSPLLGASGTLVALPNAGAGGQEYDIDLSLYGASISISLIAEGVATTWNLDLLYSADGGATGRHTPIDLTPVPVAGNQSYALAKNDNFVHITVEASDALEDVFVYVTGSPL